MSDLPPSETVFCITMVKLVHFSAFPQRKVAESGSTKLGTFNAVENHFHFPCFFSRKAAAQMCPTELLSTVVTEHPLKHPWLQIMIELNITCIRVIFTVELQSIFFTWELKFDTVKKSTSYRWMGLPVAYLLYCFTTSSVLPVFSITLFQYGSGVQMKTLPAHLYHRSKEHLFKDWVTT